VGFATQIFVDGKRIAGADYESNRLSERVHGLSSTTHKPKTPARDCEHADYADGYAYVEFWNFHWPIRYCRIHDPRRTPAARHADRARTLVDDAERRGLRRREVGR
jgi:hypothetical protein